MNNITHNATLRISDKSNVFTTAFPNINFTSSTNSSNLSTDAGRNDLLSPCPRDMWELGVGLTFAVAIIGSNIACIKVKIKQESLHHPENRYYIINLAVSNIICGVALFITNLLDVVAIIYANQLNLQICYVMCMVWGPMYIYCVMLPYVALATLGIDIAHYCHYSIDYQRRLTRCRIYVTVASGWVYTFLVVGITVASQPKVLCDKSSWKLSLLFIAFPILLIFLPAVFVILLFTFIFRKYWIKTQKLNKRIVATKINGNGTETKTRLVRKFIQKFSHLIIFSIICSVVYTTLTIVEVVVETKDDERLCVLYRLDRLFISLNSLLSPWIYCLATKEVRSKLLRKYAHWWCGKDQVVPTHSSVYGSRRDTNKSLTLQKINRRKESCKVSTLNYKQTRTQNLKESSSKHCTL